MLTGSDYKVSVIIPVFNAAKYLADAVKSVVHLQEAGEIILVEDASTDHSLSICNDLEKTYAKVRVLQHPDKKNYGVSATRNAGIKAAIFDFIAFLDADDYYLHNRFAREKEIFLSCPEVDGVYGCNLALFETETARVKFLNRYGSEQMTLSKALPPDDLFRALLFDGFGRFHTSAVTLRKVAFKKAGLFNSALLMHEDTEFWLRLSLQAKLVPGSITEPISIRRVHHNNSIHQLDNVRYYRTRMYQDLFDWAMNRSLSFDIKNSFFICLFTESKTHTNAKRFFWKQVRRKPRIMFSSFFVKKIHLLYLIR